MIGKQNLPLKLLIVFFYCTCTVSLCLNPKYTEFARMSVILCIKFDVFVIIMLF